MNIHCSVHQDWTLPTGDAESEYERAKEALAAKSAYGWADWSGQSSELATVNPPGWAVGIYKDNHRKKENLLSAQLIGVDYDDYPDELALLNDNTIARYALYVGHTPSHGLPFRTNGSRLRVVFCLDSVIDKPTAELTIAQRYELAVLALLYRLPEGYDSSCKDAARFFFGCKDIIQSYPAHVLPMVEVYKWHAERVAYESKPAPTMPMSKPDVTDKKKAYAQRKLANLVGNLATAVKGTRNDMLNSIAVQAFGLVKEGCLDRGQAERELSQTALSIGLKQDEITATLKSAYEAAEIWDLSGFEIDAARSNGHAKPEIPVTVASEIKASVYAARDAAVANQPLPVDDIKRLIGTLQNLLPNCKPEPAVSAARLAIENRERILARVGTDPLAMAFKSGIPLLDKSVNGFRRRWLYTIWGAPNMGKSSLAATITSELIKQAPGLIVSTESHHDDWHTKLAAFRLGIPIDRLFDGNLTPVEIQRLNTVYKELEACQFDMIPMIAPTLEQIEAELQSGRYPYEWLVVDSLNKMNVPHATGIYERTVAASNFLQNMARTYNLMVLCTSQVARDISKRQNKMPMLSDGYGGDASAQDSDVVMSLYYHHYYVRTGQADVDSEFPEGTAVAYVIKSRWSAGGGGIRMKFVGGVGFYGLAEERDIPPLVYRGDNVKQVDFLGNMPEERKQVEYD